jgi:hypothetical protein
MSKPLVVSIPHKLGKAEAMRRVKEGLGTTRGKFGHLLTVEQEDWSGDHVAFQVRAIAQTASGTIDFAEDSVILKVELPWLLARLAEGIQKVIRKEGTLLLENRKR